MILRFRNVLLTGAAGGIGRAVYHALRERGARVLITGRDPSALQEMIDDMPGEGEAYCAADLTDAADRRRLCELAMRWHGGIDVLINNAGVSDLALLHSQSVESLERTLATNLLAPMDLCRQLVPHLQQRNYAQIVNIGSVFGSIGYPGYTVYCASKFALRGFSEALRRELADTSVHVHYLAPRATQTAINSPAAQAMSAALGVATDPPEVVATAVVEMLQQGRTQRVLGWPEKFFAFINGVLPGMVDGALRKQLPTIRGHADPASSLNRQLAADGGRSNP